MSTTKLKWYTFDFIAEARGYGSVQAASKRDAIKKIEAGDYYDLHDYQLDNINHVEITEETEVDDGE